MKVISVPISKLKPSHYNPRKWEPKAISDLKESIKRFGLVDPILANSAHKRANIVIGGHFRLKVAKDLGFKEVPVVYISIPDIKKEQELNMRLNKNTGAWDFDLLKKFDEDFLSDIGFENFELDKIFDDTVDEDDFDVEAEAKKIKKPDVKKGDLYKLGNHYLLCGDSTKEEDVGKLMNGELADMIFTDPPYNVNYSYHSKKYKGQVMFNDNLSDDDFYKFLLGAFDNISKFSKLKMAWYIFCGYSTEPIFRKAVEASGLYFQQQIIWIKEHFVLARGQSYHRGYEPILFGKKKKGTAYRNKDMTKASDVLDLDFERFTDRLDVWYLKRDKTNEYKHPTQKPVRVAERAIKMSSHRNDIVLDLFGGGGATLIACEQLQRKCRICELDPVYAQVIKQRWEQFTKIKAKKL